MVTQPRLAWRAGETEYDRVYRLEEAWMAEQGSGSEFGAFVCPASGSAAAPPRCTHGARARTRTALNTGISHFGRQQRAGHGDDSSGTDEDVRAPLPVRQEALLPMDDGVQRPRTGTLADFTLGMFLGTFLGVIMLIWLFEGCVGSAAVPLTSALTAARVDAQVFDQAAPAGHRGGREPAHCVQHVPLRLQRHALPHRRRRALGRRLAHAGPWPAPHRCGRARRRGAGAGCCAIAAARLESC